ncbi:hypothetical protein O2W18_11475 [Modestobacter sp. VKM Ac-2983]|nr:hypothetical protein [Modestobacter sp. VKM Ac-2983]
MARESSGGHIGIPRRAIGCEEGRRALPALAPATLLISQQADQQQNS